MTPKEKAEQLLSHYNSILIDEISHGGARGYASYKCALIAVDEIIESLYDYDKNTENHLNNEFPNYFSCEVQNMESDLRFWDKVKEEIEKL